MKNIWQPKLDDSGNVIGHEKDTLFSFQVFSSKKILLQYFPKAIPVKYGKKDIEDFTLIQ